MRGQVCDACIYRFRHPSVISFISIELLELKNKIPILLEEEDTYDGPAVEEDYNNNIMMKTRQLEEYKYISSLAIKLESKLNSKDEGESK